MGARILCNKVLFLIRSLQDQSDSLKSQAFNSLATLDVMSMSIVKQCKLLDEELGSDFTIEVLSQPQTSQRELKECIIHPLKDVILLYPKLPLYVLISYETTQIQLYPKLSY